MALKTFAELGGSGLDLDLPNAPQQDQTNLLIVDGNNLGYRYLKRKNFNSFQDDYYRTVESLAKSYACKDILVAYDFGKSQYRKQLLPEYKANRTISEEDKEHYDMFFAELNRTSANIPFNKANFFGVEADDIIAYFVLNLYQHYKDVWIISSDRDLYQLLKGNVHIFNLFSRKEITMQGLYDEKGIKTHEYMLSRIIQGDSGDNIKGIEGIGEKRGQDIAKTYQGSLEKLLTALPIKGKSKYIQNLNAGVDILVRNEKLINLSAYNRAVIGYGDKGQEYLDTLDKLIAPMKEYPIVEVPSLILEKQYPLTDALSELKSEVNKEVF